MWNFRNLGLEPKTPVSKVHLKQAELFWTLRIFNYSGHKTLTDRGGGSHRWGGKRGWIVGSAYTTESFRLTST
jgi:hypothetical protein